MTVAPFDQLLERLSEGDLTAAEEIFRDYEPYLRMVVRRGLPGRLRAKFDSMDVVQSVWVHVLHNLHRAKWYFPDRASLLALLTTVTRRRLISRFRSHRVALASEQPGPCNLEEVPARRARPSEVAQAEELWEQLLALCPPAHRDVLLLKRQGFCLGEIAVRTGLHEGSVRRILRRLARDMSLRCEPLGSQPGALGRD